VVHGRLPMMFLRTHSGDLISLVDTSRIYEHAEKDGGRAIITVLRAEGSLIKLARDYSMERLARALDPVRR
jgi:hypothetical protein